ncbi:GNAT family N-acetyltransferase [Spirosoma harenae]
MRLVELTATNNFGYASFMQAGFVAHQDCFRISPADAFGEPFPTTGQPDSFTLGVLSSTNELVGSVSFKREGEARKKLRHKGLLFAMYVAADYSGQGIGRMLLEETIRRARCLPTMEQINLSVLAANERAKRQYQKLGFRSFSFEKNAIKDGDRYYDEELMVLFLNDIVP